MAYEENLRSISLDADSTLALYTGVPSVPGSASPNYGNQYRFVKMTGAHTVGRCSGATNEQPIGVMQNKPQVNGQAATVGVSGITNVLSGGAIAAGDSIGVDSVGRAVTIAPGTANSLGVAVLSCAAANQLVSVQLRMV